MTTKQTAICDALARLGHTEIPGYSRKYRTFKRQRGLYFVGKNGALRTGLSVTDSYPLLARTIQAIILEAKSK